MPMVWVLVEPTDGAGMGETAIPTPSKDTRVGISLHMGATVLDTSDMSLFLPIIPRSIAVWILIRRTGCIMRDQPLVQRHLCLSLLDNKYFVSNM